MCFSFASTLILRLLEHVSLNIFVSLGSSIMEHHLRP